MATAIVVEWIVSGLLVALGFAAGYATCLAVQRRGSKPTGVS